MHKNYSCSSQQPSEVREGKCQSAGREVKSRNENGDLHKQQYIPTVCKEIQTYVNSENYLLKKLNILSREQE